MKIREYLGQVLLIVFSVLLGLFLNEKIIEYNDKKESQKIQEILRIEVESNYQLVKTWAPHHIIFKDRLDSLIHLEEFLQDFIQDKSVFYHKTFGKLSFINRMPASDAWEIAKSNRLIHHIGYEKLLTLSKTYHQQKDTFDPALQLFEVYNNPSINNPELALSNLISIYGYLNEVVGREILLLEYYEETLSLLGS